MRRREIVKGMVGIGMVPLAGCSTIKWGTCTPPPPHPFLCTDNGNKRVVMISVEGKLDWEYSAPGCHDAWLLANGNILLTGGFGVREVTRDKKTVWEYACKRPNEIHSCQPLPGGRTLVADSEPCRLVELDAQGKTLKQIPLKTKAKNIHSRYRLARKTRRGTYLVTFVGEGAVREYDSEGKTLRNMPDLGQPFAALLLPNDNILVSCGDAHRIVEIDPQDKVVWKVEENDIPGNPLRFAAGMQRLPNGNTVVANWSGHGHVGKQPQLFEITREKKLVWQFHNNDLLRTVSNVQLLDVEGDVRKGEILR